VFASVVVIAFQKVYMPMIYFNFLKIIFDISTSKQSKKYKPHSILAKTNYQNLMKAKQTLYVVI